MTTFTLIQDAKKEAGKYAGFWEVDQPMFNSKKYGISEQWKLGQHFGIKPEGSFTLLAA